MDNVLKEAAHRQRVEVARVLHGPMAVLAHQCLQALRRADDTFCLRSASINLFNGMVSLTFSCDGSHCMRYDEFLKKNVAFWVGSAAWRHNL